MNPEQKAKVRELFKEELYKYFVDSKGSELENTYNSVKSSGAMIDFLMAQKLRGNKIFESEIGDILMNINERLVNKINSTGIIDLRQIIFNEFNSL